MWNDVLLVFLLICSLTFPIRISRAGGTKISLKSTSDSGVKLQDENVLGEGYTTSIEKDYCQRCFRIKNYGE